MEPGQSGPDEGPRGPEQGSLTCVCASCPQLLALGTQAGFRLFSLTSVDTLDCIYHSGTHPGRVPGERLFSSSLVVVVSASMPERINIYHFKKGTEICSYSYPRPVRCVRLNRQRLVVCLEESIYIHNIKDMKLLQTLGVCGSYLAFPSSLGSGELQLYDAAALSPVTVIPAHHSPLAALCFNASASRLASASQKGTVIRVFSVPQGQRLFEFRRGMKRCVDISCLSFSPDGHFLCSSSNTETVHIFRMDQHPEPSAEEADASSWGSYVGRIFSAASTYLPAPVSDMMSQDRAFATAQLPEPGQRNTCTLTVIQKLPRLLVATAEGKLLYIYSMYNIVYSEVSCVVSSPRLFPEAKDQSEENITEASSTPSAPRASYPSYAATAALPPAPGLATATLTGYSEDGGCREGEVIPEHELAAGPVQLDDESEFPPRDRWCRCVQSRQRFCQSPQGKLKLLT
uniref:WD repeat domain, phosphoinositide interacting 1 n=1 Tax=Neogobius melanostomus TaxID=47308 RepID=A0A8C6S7N4_9GOBI